jgi:hypothetical protein
VLLRLLFSWCLGLHFEVVAGESLWMTLTAFFQLFLGKK